jgi:tRNA threonylcarbamoyl adenosine modification protein YeaZ
MAGVLLLAFDTATAAVTVALHDGTTVLAEHTEADARRHGELLAPGIGNVLAKAGRDRTELTDIAVGVGPGPFTGLRVGLVTALALSDALCIPVHGVCTLDTVAADVMAGVFAGKSVGVPFAVATDARRREVYWALYDASGRRITEPAVDRPQTVAPLVEGMPVAGEGPVLYPDAFPDRRDPVLPSAAVLAGIAARALAAEQDAAAETPGRPSAPPVPALLPPVPLYLRRPDAVEPAARKRVSQPALR